MIDNTDIKFMREAMALAQHGEGCVNPNPMVGALVVRDGVVVAQGYHARYGDLHAERNAFRDADARGIDCAGTTMYVTLEPCCHHGHQPPCTEAVIAHRVSRVVVGLLDPNPLVAGGGIRQLQAAGIQVEVIDQESELAQQLRWQNRLFLHYITTHRPWVVAKYAMTLDGKICTRTGDSQWITGEAARHRVHQLRRWLPAIVCGSGTVLADNPSLTTRLTDDPEARNPIRLVLDRRLRTPPTCQLVQTALQVRTILVYDNAGHDTKQLQALHDAGVETWCCPTLHDLMDRCAQEHIDGLLLEGGGTVNEAFIREGLIDEVYAFVGPLITGGSEAKTPVEGQGFDRLSESLHLRIIDTQLIGQDVLIHARTDSNP